MTDEAIIRYARPEDFDAWLVLWQGYQAFYQTSIAEATTIETWQRFHDASEPMWCSVAEQDGRLVGLVHHILHRSCWTTGDYCYLQDLYVDETCRGRGLGRALIGHVGVEARSRGASRVHWLTHETNHDAMKLYDQVAGRSGFIQYRILF